MLNVFYLPVKSYVWLQGEMSNYIADSRALL